MCSFATRSRNGALTQGRHFARVMRGRLRFAATKLKPPRGRSLGCWRKQMFDSVDGSARRLLAGFDQLISAPYFVPAYVADPWPDHKIGILPLVRCGGALDHHDRLKKHADCRLRRT